MKKLLVLIYSLISHHTLAAPDYKNFNLLKVKYTKSSSVRKSIPNTPALDGIFPPMSASHSPRWEYLKTQYNQWYYQQAPANNKGIRGAANGEAWRYDPMKTLVELCRRADLVGESIPGVCTDAKDTIAEFFSKQHWGVKGEYPDCSGGITGISRGN